ncbi:FAS1-like dehydratase domain-containing protein [Desulfosporosinus hippei]|uniref:N-terminal half of MaoC dehydratase n=1 Tax=Desulfosporosinus hippei DSM 8344 TaxID=1121419 RepID=A0A1G8I4D7_9FIRM|nr:MaoC family dehydratase N-terminal domain-containing protein [Desulfosporosinus hippei]SDI13826.1 N-terminal half of MaoC dehydratase [Desulfosporosinus hippei DSM 8344]
MINKELIGRESEAIAFKIRLEDVRRFAEAIGVRFDDRVPATFVGTLVQANIPGVQLPTPGMIHGEQRITYYRPLNVGDSLTYKKSIKDVYEGRGKFGKNTFLVLETTGYDLAGELVFSSSSVLIQPSKEEGE